MVGVVGMFALGVVHRSGWAATPQQPRAESAAELAFDRAWRDVVLGAQKSEKAGDWVLEKAEDGAIVARRRAHEAGTAAERGVDDAAILTKVKARLLADPSTSSRTIEVDVHNGVVTMTGQVEGNVEAKTALRLAGQTAGVTGVVSRLRWPGMAPSSHSGT